MKRHIDKHLIGGITVCAVITVTLALSAALLNVPTPPAEAATQSMYAQPIAEGSATSWIGYPKPTWGYVNIDETTTCNASDYNYTLTQGLPSTTSTVGTETYRASLSTIPNSNTIHANDGTGNLIKTSYRIVKIEVVPCLALHLPAPKSSEVSVFYRYTQYASSTLTESPGRPYTITSNLFQVQPTASWTTSVDKYASSVLEIGVRYTGGNGGARISQLKTRVTYVTVVETIPAVQPVTMKTHPTVTQQELASHTLANTDQDLSKFLITSDDAGTSYVKQISFKVSKSTGVSLSNFRLRRGASDIALGDYAVTYVPSSNNPINAETGSIGSASGTGYLVVSFTNEEAIAGSGHVYTLHATVSGATAGAFVKTSFYVKPGAPLVKGFLQNASAVGDFPGHADIFNIDTANIHDGAANIVGDFVWSDGSGVPHLPTVQGSRDWLNGVTLVNLTTSESLSL